MSSYCLREDSNGEKMTDALHFIFIELGRFTKELDEGLDERDWWMYSLKNIGKMGAFPEKGVPQEIKRLYDVTEVESLDRNEKSMYLQNMRTEFDIRTEKLMAREEGRIEGKEAGIKIGMERGREAGREAEQQRIAYTLKSMGMSADDIIKATGLSAEAVAALN